MNRMKEYNIVFSGLKLGMHHFEYQLNKEFFSLFEFDEIDSPELLVKVEFEKKSTMIDLHFALSGHFNAVCDVSNREFEQEVSNEFELVVKFGEEYNNEDDIVLILTHGTYELNLAQYLYELAVLAIPAKNIHPDVENGKMDDEINEMLDLYSGKSANSNENATDPRWDKLKELKNKD